MILRDSGLLEELHGGVHQAPPWASFLEALRAQTHAMATTLTLRGPDRRIIFHRQSGAKLSAPGEMPVFGQHSWAMLADRHQREGRIYSLEDLLDPADPMYRAVIGAGATPQPMNQLRSVRVAEPGGTEAWLACIGGRAIGAPTGAVLNALVPHLRIALRSLLALERETANAGISAAALARRGLFWLTLDAQRRVLEMSPQVKALLNGKAPLSLAPDNRLLLRSPAANRALDAQLASCAEGHPRLSAIMLSTAPRIGLLLAPAPRHGRIIPAAELAIAYLSFDPAPAPDQHAPLAQFFQLLPSEARLAWAMANGRSIAEAAAELNLTLETARNYSKKIYAKTGARGQAELVRIILTSVLALL